MGVTKEQNPTRYEIMETHSAGFCDSRLELIAYLKLET